jgi:hypothetical protein
MRTRRIWLALSWAWLVLLCGCIEFEKQTLTYRYDVATDTLRMYQCYQGIFGVDDDAGLTESELDQLKSVLNGQRTFFFANWIFEYNREGLKEALGNLKKRVEGDGPKMDAAMVARAETLIKLALENVAVENGPLYLGESRKLSGVQQVTVKQFSKIVKAGNACIRDAYVLEAAKEGTSSQARVIYLEFARDARDCVTIEGNQLRARLPVTREDYDKTFGPDQKLHSEFVRGGGRIVYADNELQLTLGDNKAPITKLTLSMSGSEKNYTANAIGAAKKQATVLATFDAEAAAAKFLEQK